MSRPANANRALTRAIALMAFAVQVPHAHAEPPAKAQVAVIDLAAEASRDAPNDLARATAYFEAQEASSAEVARRVNRAIAGGLDIAKAYGSVKAKSGNTST